MTLDILLKKLVRGPLSRSHKAFVLLPVNLPLVGRSRGMESIVIRPVLVVVIVVVGMLVTTRTSPITTKIGVVLRCGKVSKRHWQ